MSGTVKLGEMAAYHFVLVHCLVEHVVVLVVGLSQYGPGHLQLASVIALILVFFKLISEFVCTHVLLNSIDNFNDIVNVFFKFFAFLKTCHADEVGLLVVNLAEVPSSWNFVSPW